MTLGPCGFLILIPTHPHGGVFNSVAGTGLGYLLELWMTSRSCWMCSAQPIPPGFAILAHGIAALAFRRGGVLDGAPRRPYEACVAPIDHTKTWELCRAEDV